MAKTPLEQAEEVLAIQGEHGNWNYDPYMLGMYNGMALIVSIMRDDGRDPDYRNAPKHFLLDNEEN